MFTEKIKELQALITSTQETIDAKTAEVLAMLQDNKLEDARAKKEEIATDKEALKNAKNDLELFESMAKTGGAEKAKAGKVVEPTNEEPTYREKVNEFLHSKGAIRAEGLNFAGKDEILVPYNEITPTTDGVTKADTKPVTSEEISYNPEREIMTVVDLKKFVTIHNAKKGAGKYPILKRATTKMVSVPELEKNPALAKPEFSDVSWEVVTYRGAIPLSQESIDDADVDLLSIVSEGAQQIKTNTTNSAIADILKTFTAKTVASLDDIKHIYNVDLDPAYSKGFVVSQSFYQILDTLKDGNGRYLLQDSIVSASGKVFASYPIFVLSDDVFGKAGDAKGFVGDFKRGVLFADRKDLGLRWADNEIYGQYLQVVTRFDVKVADAKAGYFVTWDSAAPTTTTTTKKAGE